MLLLPPSRSPLLDTSPAPAAASQAAAGVAAGAGGASASEDAAAGPQTRGGVAGAGLGAGGGVGWVATASSDGTVVLAPYTAPGPVKVHFPPQLHPTPPHLAVAQHLLGRRLPARSSESAR